MPIEWNKYTPEHFGFDVVSEDIEEHGDYTVFPCRVALLETGEHAVDLPIPIKAGYVAQLHSKGDEGVRILQETIHSRVIAELKKRIAVVPVSIETKIDFHKLGQVAIKEKGTEQK